MTRRYTDVVDDAHEFVEQTLRQQRVLDTVNGQAPPLVVCAIVQVCDD